MTAREAVSVVVLLALVVLVLWAMRAGWNHRRRRTEGLVGELPPVPADLGGALAGPFDAVYVSTTRAGDWLDRVVAQDLGVRSQARVSVHESGVLVARSGTRDVFIPAAALRGVGNAPGIAGKVVGNDGLVVLTWRPVPTDDRGLDTGLRPKHAADGPALVAAATALINRTSLTEPDGTAADGRTNDGTKEKS
ncbi:PH-like domain-containing protein [Cellulomonas edaphi]|uniref:PH domain-containing protein n=1 Tax=Cellulomonas edaphi TaxID=3053468 RepID=A0ABT7S6H5_9CELL|nr:hypothetical protein [Cellulomons edaphi]MDM7831206.1 hypothetical protein [Cellulomons edaphi]